MAEQGNGAKSLAALIEQRRRELGWSKKVAAERCGFADNEYQTFVSYTTGAIKSPPPDKLAMLARGLGLDMRRVLEVSGYAPLLPWFRPEPSDE